MGNGIGQKNLEQALARYVEIGVESGVATSGSNTTLEDTTKNWEVNRWAGGDIHIVKGATEYVRTIASNTATVITFAALPALITVAAGDLYSVRRIAVPMDITDRWARQLGQIDIARVLGAALAHANPVIMRLTDGAAFIDPRSIRALLATDIVTVQSLTQWAGVALTGRDISLDLANLDAALSTRATEATLAAKLDANLDDLKGAYRLGVKDFSVASGEVIFISSGSETALNNLSVAGIYRNDGLTTVKEALSVSGRLINHGTLEIGGRW